MHAESGTASTVYGKTIKKGVDQLIKNPFSFLSERKIKGEGGGLAE